VCFLREVCSGWYSVHQIMTRKIYFVHRFGEVFLSRSPYIYIRLSLCGGDSERGETVRDKWEWREMGWIEGCA
jgi:hypothetical protein